VKLISLTANKASFHEIIFKDGVNIIAGKQASNINGNGGKTYNGVGKSLIIHLLHFCLGSNKIEDFEDNLPGWEFTLKFSNEGKEYTSSRSTDNQNKIKYSESIDPLTLSKFREEMLKLCFNIEEPPKHMTWNTLFPRFARRSRASYISFDTFVKKEKDYAKLLNNGFILGLDKSLIVEKQELRKKQSAVTDTEKVIRKDPLFKQYFLGKSDVEFESFELKHKILELQTEVDEFKVSSNYHDLEKELSEIRFSKKQKENERSLIKSNINNIKKSLEKEINISSEQLFEVYNSAKIELPNVVKNNITNVLDFHNELIKNRTLRLNEELKKNKEYLKTIDNEISSLGDEMDQLYYYLGSHGALDEYQVINNQLSLLKQKKDKIDDYQDILKTYQNTSRDIKTEYIEQEKITEKYLEDSKEFIDSLKSTFYNLSKEFYDKKTGGLIINNNSGENLLRFNINAKIDDDSSDGVNEVKMFCFDVLLLLSKVSNIQFLFHDSRLFSNMDPRQRKIVFEEMDKLSKEHDVQYICSLNEDAIQSIETLTEEKEFENLIEKNIILELTDESAESKLLGIQVDINLEKK
jgi:Uncharacterized protein conserved in bacteria